MLGKIFEQGIQQATHHLEILHIGLADPGASAGVFLADPCFRSPQAFQLRPKLLQLLPGVTWWQTIALRAAAAGVNQRSQFSDFPARV